MRFFFAVLALTVLAATPGHTAQLPNGAASCKIARLPSIYRTDGIREPYYALYIYDAKEVLFLSKNIEAAELQKHYQAVLPASDRAGNPGKGPQLIAGCSYKDLVERSSGPTGDPWFELP